MRQADDLLGGASDAIAPDAVADASALDLGVAPRLKAEEFRAEDLDGILDGVSSTGNLNFAVLHAGVADALGPVLVEGDGVLNGVTVGVSDAVGIGGQALYGLDQGDFSVSFDGFD
ncbi:MAG: hypothetical protein KDA48_03045, partial [Amphiplicatus sp.]|nr:hypothetical protein [Amphiplicatus sp.]